MAGFAKSGGKDVEPPKRIETHLVAPCQAQASLESARRVAIRSWPSGTHKAARLNTRTETGPTLRSQTRVTLVLRLGHRKRGGDRPPGPPVSNQGKHLPRKPAKTLIRAADPRSNLPQPTLARSRRLDK